MISIYFTVKVKKTDEIIPDLDMTKYFVGDVSIKKIITKSDSDEVELFEVQFYNGARTRLHYHEVDQILIGNKGQGKIALYDGIKLSDTESGTILFKTQRMLTGDVILIPAYTWHWHGAIEKGNFGHYQLKKTGNTIWLE